MTAPSFDEDALDFVYQSALSHEKAGRPQDAAAAWRECLAIDPDDHVGARLRLSALGLGEVPASAGEAYVTTLFDQQAEMFEDILVRQLGYDVPSRIADILSRLGHGLFGRALDLGCGTGLVGVALDGRVDEMLGVDLSENMIEIAFDSEAYDHLYIGEAVDFLDEFEEPEPFDLIVAADVLPYLGSLTPLFQAAAKRLGPDGLFVASTETFAGEGEPEAGFAVGRDHRFHHAERYVRREIEAAGLAALAFEPIIVRMQEGRPAPGHLIVARKMS
ncbi:methyltransferase domain-containing protein [Jiella sp. MQZ9-1]|uniref:Methyltransferase domain-containing protein n=1 Tax=Jiella flava TaxID=2816857 RepID=A0A939JV34_9HYPH|nr:methyltransferase domain-containing protein [Jiella flava]MBO0662029.1 methyltransferase domain-containing protein [Jiella flava]MCD2470644.1 methyltransferase domain-containing protein [Jiella flava]